MLFLRRTNNTTLSNEYLFLPSDSMSTGGMGRPIAPVLPGNSSTTLFGNSSPNFILDLGMKQMRLRILGPIVEVTSSQLPTPLPASSLYLYDSGTSGTATTQNAKSIRNVLLKWWADQGLQGTGAGTYSGFALGWPQWGGASVTSLFGTTYQIWEGVMPDAPTIIEDGGVEGQFPYSFEWIVGDT